MSTHKGRPTKEILARVRSLAAAGKSPEEIAADVGARPRAVKRWLAKGGGDVALPSPAPGPDGAPSGSEEHAAPKADAGKTIKELFGDPPPPNSAGASSDGTTASEPVDDPLDAEVELSPSEVIAACDFVVGTTDSVLHSIFGGPPPQGMSDGQRALVKAFSKRLSRAVNELLGGPSKLTAGETVVLALGILIVPRGIQRVGIFLRERRKGRPLSRRPEDGQDGGGDRVGEASGN